MWKSRAEQWSTAAGSRSPSGSRGWTPLSCRQNMPRQNLTAELVARYGAPLLTLKLSRYATLTYTKRVNVTCRRWRNSYLENGSNYLIKFHRTQVLSTVCKVVTFIQESCVKWLYNIQIISRMIVWCGIVSRMWAYFETKRGITSEPVTTASGTWSKNRQNR